VTTDAGTTWRELLAETQATLGNKQDARFLCEHAAGLDATEFTSALGEVVSQRMGGYVQEMVRRRLAGEPLQYVMGRWAFRHLDLLVDARVLIPRPETELVTQVALEAARVVQPTRVVVDLGTGSGAIGLSLAHELPLAGTTVWLTDVSPDALDVARANLAGIGRNGANVRIAAGDWFAALPADLAGTVDVLVANPPYVAENDGDVEDAVARHEPHLALFSGNDGLDAIRVIAAGVCNWLRPGGVLVLEIGHQQGAAVRDVLAAHGLRDVQIRCDLTGRDRIAVAHA
jgi:release factor glutamine methyltransferase